MVFKKKSSVLWIYKNTKMHIPKIILLSVINGILAFIGVALALLSKRIIDSAVKIAGNGNSGDKEYDELIVFGVLLLVVITVRLILRITVQSVSVKVQANMEMRMRADLFQSIIKKKFSRISEYHSGELMNRLTSDIGIVSSGMVSILPDITFLFFQLVGALTVLMVFDWRFALVFVFGGIVVFIIVSLFRKKFKDLHKLVQSTDGKARSFFQEAIESLLIVKTFGIEDEMDQRAGILQMDNYNAKMSRRRVSIFANAGFNFVFNVGYLYALIWCSVKLCNGQMTYGTLTAVLQLISQVQTPFVNFTKIFPQIFGIVASSERIMEIENIEAEDEGEHNTVYKNNIDVDAVYGNLAKIVFENVNFSYGRDTVIENGCFELGKGEFVAIRGISGIGKSTLLKLLLGVFKPNEGDIYLEMRDKTKIPAGTYTRALFSYVPQGNYLFSGTLKDNLLLVNPNATKEEIDEALELGDCTSFVAELPDGLETVIGEKGLGLSEGQVQRLAIARAVLSKSPVILLDEATSALDAQTEEIVLNKLKDIKNITCIIITHKTAALKVCNSELIIKDKKLIYNRLD
ncbi:MAG: ABC transporter ATP-binding protein [Lachnospiraceae bacterium]|nr:ABC transporter ATP-binding protein [Lachnospiraceae bacterium]